MDDTRLPSTITFPQEDLAATLFELFFRHFTPFLPIIHRPSFEAQYRDRVHLRNASFAMVVLLVCAIASRYCDDPRVCLKGGGRPSAGWKYFVQVKDLKRSLHAPAKLSDLQTYAVCCLVSANADLQMLTFGLLSLWRTICNRQVHLILLGPSLASEFDVHKISEYIGKKYIEELSRCRKNSGSACSGGFTNLFVRCLEHQTNS